MLTMEALFTAILAWRLHGETMDRRIWLAMLILLTGGVLLVIDQGSKAAASFWACWRCWLPAAWGMDNTLSRALADRDPGQVVLLKAIFGACITMSGMGAVGTFGRRRRPSLVCWQSALLVWSELALHFAGAACGSARPGRARCSPLRPLSAQPRRLRWRPLSGLGLGAGRFVDAGRRDPAPG